MERLLLQLLLLLHLSPLVLFPDRWLLRIMRIFASWCMCVPMSVQHIALSVCLELLLLLLMLDLLNGNHVIIRRATTKY
jgi:hypothetical protein